MTEPVWIYSGKPTLTNRGYLTVWLPQIKRNRYLHRVIVENSIGRMLSKDEMVHHKNGIRTDNRIENLEVMTKYEHLEKHDNLSPMIDVVCPVCGKERKMREADRRNTRHGACKECKNIKANETRFIGYMHFWANWETGEISEPYKTRSIAYRNRIQGFSIVSYNSLENKIRSDRATIPANISAAIRARSGAPEEPRS